MKLKPQDIKKYNTLSKKKPVMVRVGTKWYTWSEGDPKYGVFLTTDSGRDVEFDLGQIDDIEEGIAKLTKPKLKEIIKEVINEGSKLRDFLADGDTVVTYRDQTDFQMAYAQDVYNKVIGSLKTEWLPFYFDGTSVVNSRDDDVDVKGLSNVKWGKITYKQLKDAIVKKLPPKKYPMKKSEW